MVVIPDLIRNPESLSSFPVLFLSDFLRINKIGAINTSARIKNGIPPSRWREL
jgi:hypothetical protein